MVPMNWIEKMQDEVISQKFFFGVIFALCIVVVKMTPEQSDTFKALIYATMGASGLKSVGGGLKAIGGGLKKKVVGRGDST